jgi:ATP-dependent RNA helicase SUPV3L1/SUV3
VRALETPAQPLKTAGILPPDDVIYRFCNYFPPGTPFSYMLMRLHEICQSSQGFHLCRLKDQVKIADIIHGIPNLDVIERLQLASAPVAVRDKTQQELIRAMATCIAEQKGGALLDLPCFNLEVLDKAITGTRTELRELETLHKGLVMYMWLSFRFPGVFTTRPLANHAKELVESAIEKCLRMLNFQDRAQARKRLREKSVLDEVHEDILKQQWSGDGEESIIEAKVLEEELQAAAEELESEEDGLLEDDRLEKRSFEENTMTNEEGVDDEGEYPEEDEELDSDVVNEAVVDEVLMDELVMSKTTLSIDGEEPISTRPVGSVEIVQETARPSITIPFQSEQPLQENAKP